ncbi:hypothetical protein F4556_002346 [Kitasatospora gansuensis]|uniref:Uncharacterized protein n=1 Tax=Kitasatospora gansuensis TaxID=258050 RepID=A0A7W7SCC8_9ACTN|nr:hypothetical protein [Kitasatospora gansuensis]MBB4946811.1 hypothetical protein [Kitasatospora gansuensis]
MTTAPQRPPGPMAPDTAALRNPDLLLTDSQFASVVNTILDNNPSMTTDMAKRIAVEGIRFVVTGALRPELAMAPSRIVDEGWHALIMHTTLYADLCERFGQFVHHAPGFDPDHFDPDILENTQRAIQGVGFEVDADLWRAPDDNSLVSVAANCQHAPNCSTIKPTKPGEKPCHKPSK